MLDEPSEGLAPQIVADVHDIVAELAESGLTILPVEQKVNMADSLADRHYVSERGSSSSSDNSRIWTLNTRTSPSVSTDRALRLRPVAKPVVSCSRVSDCRTSSKNERRLQPRLAACRCDRHPKIDILALDMP